MKRILLHLRFVSNNVCPNPEIGRIEDTNQSVQLGLNAIPCFPVYSCCRKKTA